ncbi:transketolase family protein [Tepidimicrobium xylanilyticum]|uniref:transketolase family protein n=1 Tax=Tepidimicrobium xylanilyticum TaxID=1123352 RepID=UPI0026518FFA|nr:transketolase C-terminal domain-containing protein [Tepidimicrobium xylanilyticum]GMG95328.1 transketolase [Tepidimicrobium xylanilyticum]
MISNNAVKEMRQVLYEFLDKKMEEDKRIVVIDADLSKSNGTYNLRKKYPDRAFDVGVAEQNMAGIAAGMASYGFIPFISTFAPFATRRICDQVAVSIAYANRNVKIIGSDPGIVAELNGGTHMSFEDIGVFRSIPNIVIFEPVDVVQLKKALPQIVEYEGPLYIRFFRKLAPIVFNEDYKFNLFRADLLKEGKDITIIASGIMVYEALLACEKLESKGIDVELISIHTIKPIDKDCIIKSASKTKKVVTCENHSIIGGLRSAVSEVLSESYPVMVKGIGIEDRFGQVGKLPYLKKEYGLEVDNIVNTCIQLINS